MEDGVIAKGIISRHGVTEWEKEVMAEEKVSGGHADKMRKHVTPESVERLAAHGAQYFAGREYGTVLAHTSDHIRTYETLQALIASVKAPQTTIEMRPELGFGHRDWSMSPPHVPKYVGGDIAKEKEWMMAMFGDLYFPKQPVDGLRAPSGAERIVDVYSSLKTILEQARDGTAFAQITHGGIVDAIPILVSGALGIDPAKRTVTIDAARFPDPMQTEEYLSARIVRGQTPALEIDVGGKVQGHTMRDLERVIAVHSAHLS